MMQSEFGNNLVYLLDLHVQGRLPIPISQGSGALFASRHPPLWKNDDFLRQFLKFEQD
jgi:hypothetical protein